MKKLLISLVALISLAGISFADIQADIDSARALYDAEEYVQAQAAYEQILLDYPEASIDRLADAQRMIGRSLRSQGKHEEALIEFQKVIDNYPEASIDRLAYAQRMIGESLSRQGKHEEANEAYLKAAFDYGFISLGHQEIIFRDINTIALGTEGYKEYLRNLLLIVPAVPENVEFLGRVSSQLDVLR